MFYLIILVSIKSVSIKQNISGSRSLLWSMSKYDIDSMTVKEILAVPELVRVIEKHMPGITGHPLLFMVKRKTLPEVLNMAKGYADPEKIRAMREEIARL